MIVAYAPNALIYNSSAGTWTLRPDFNPVDHRVEIQFNDDDNILDGDSPGDEVGTDTNQTAVIDDMMGNPVSSGVIYNEEYYGITMPSGTQYIDVLEIGGVVVGYLATDALVPGVAYPVTEFQDVDAGTALAYSAYYDVACFAPGTLIRTSGGDIPVELLSAGDQVVTRDNGIQTLRELRRTRHSRPWLSARPNHWPVEINAAHLGRDRPSGRVLLSPQHRVLLQHGAVGVLFGYKEVFVQARHLGRPSLRFVPDIGLTYHHLLFDQHEIVRADGFWCESLYGGDALHGATARPCLKKWEALVVRAYLGHTRTQRVQAA